MDLLRELQLVETEMLAVLDRVCNKYQIEYFVMFGTALGAVRHKGFIPWDDDIDIGMRRSDYQKLREIPEEEWEGLLLVDAESECSFHYKVFPRLYKPGTILENQEWFDWVKDCKLEGEHKPIWIDIFLFDSVESLDQAKIIANRAFKLRRQWTFAKYKMHPDHNQPFSKFMKYEIKSLYHTIINIFSGPENVLKRYYSIVSSSRGEYYISYDSWTLRDIYSTMMKAEDLFPVERLPFENIEVNVPHNVKKHLEKTYGDYMQLPPEKERIGHMPKKIFLGK